MSRVILMAGTQKGAFLFYSDEAREVWHIEGPLHKGWNVFDVQMDQRLEPALYAALGHYVYGATIQYSHDFGHEWTMAESNPTYAEGDPSKMKDIWCVVPGPPSQPETLYAGVAEAGIFVSHDRGKNWAELPGLSHHGTREEWMPGFGGLCCHTILWDKDNPKRLWAAISAVGVFRSDDGGSTWKEKNDGLEIIIEGQKHKCVGSCVHSMVQDPADPNRLFQQNHRGVYASTDGGDSWGRIENGLPSTFGFPIALSPRQPDTLFIALQESDEFRMAIDGKLAIHRSTDAGKSWQALRKGLPDKTWAGVMRQALTTDSLDETGVYFGTSSGQIYYSRNNGDSWQAIPCTLPRINSLRVAVVG
ncbi:MAG: exo-alpha-sialidase [Candidatus Hydrogenedentes bacterium]|nr:exo-alpha-sialidase [Candidatus Hydrogenedentota bacterium]